MPPGGVVADIGTDHGLLPAYLLVTGRSPRAIATDIRPGPLAQARATVSQFGLQDQVDLRLGDGLAPLRPGEAGVIVISGMGGRRMAGILAARPEVSLAARRLVLQPNTEAADLRRWLVEHGFQLLEEELAREGEKIAEVMAAAAGREPAPPVPLAGLDWEVGPRLWERRHPLLGAFLAHRVERCRAALAGMERGGRHGEGYDSLRSRLAALEGLLAALAWHEG